MSRPEPVAVVHLARQLNGEAALQAFVRSYAANEAGMPHRLVAVLKGYDEGSAADLSARRLLGPLDAEVLRVPDDGLDLDAYRAAVAATGYAHYLFLNSFVRFEATGWLQKIFACGSRQGVGIAGATGSWQSVVSDEIDLIRGRIRQRFGPPEASPPGAAEAPASASPRRPTESGALAACGALWHSFRRFPAFPNHHIRTNGFLLSRAVLSRLTWARTATKLDAHLIESGRNGLTAQVLRAGLEAVVVGRDGRGYPRHQWHASGAFWQGDQENLLIADNKTKQYQDASPAERQWLSRSAWRGLAAPGKG
ncbi:MAG: hypothetical protein ABI423_07410 [Burkholderiales bacterium]